MNKTETLVKDKLWLFASRAHDDDHFFKMLSNVTYSKKSRITPAEGATMLGTPNVIMVQSDGIPVPYSNDAYGYMESFCRMKNVLWSVTGSGGSRCGEEEDFICTLAEKYPNVTGAFFDDFTGNSMKRLEHSPEFISDLFKKVRNTLDKACRPMELWSTCYTNLVERFPASMYDPLDGITIWNMATSEIPNMDADFSTYEKLLPTKRKMLGIYLFDYGKGVSVEKELMEMQCETGLQWLKEGRIEGMVFLTNCVMGIGLESDYWLRSWIDKVGNEVLK